MVETILPSDWLRAGHSPLIGRSSGAEASSSLTFSDLATLLRGGADILETNAPRLTSIVQEAGQQG